MDMTFLETAGLLGNIGEFVGAMGVIATLVYLALQIRHNTHSTRAMTFSSLATGWQEMFQGFDQADYELFIRALLDEPNLTETEFLRVFYVHRAIFRRMENDFYQHQAGAFDHATWEAYAAGYIGDLFASPSGRAMWRVQRETFSEECAAYIDQLCDRGLAGGPAEYRGRYQGHLADEVAAQRLAAQAAG
jgi:hypothetical protein